MCLDVTSSLSQEVKSLNIRTLPQGWFSVNFLICLIGYQMPPTFGMLWFHSFIFFFKGDENRVVIYIVSSRV